MKLQKHISIILALILSSISANAQIVVNNDSIAKEILNPQLKLVEDFMSRFNEHSLNTRTENIKRINLMNLFDNNMFGYYDTSDARYKLAMDFIDDIIKSNTLIHYEDTLSWFACVPCHGLLEGRPVDFFLFLNVENYGKDLYKWTIAKAKGDIFKILPAGSYGIISPNAHETDFTNLKEITYQIPDRILNFRQNKFSLDETTVFYLLVYSGHLKIEYVHDIQYYFLQVPDWIFTIQCFNRMQKNGGWLITDFQKISNKDKEIMRHDFFYTNLSSDTIPDDNKTISTAPTSNKTNNRIELAYQNIPLKMIAFKDTSVTIKCNKLTLKSQHSYIGETEIPQELWNTVMGKSTNEKYDDDKDFYNSQRKKFLKKINKTTKLNFRWATDNELEFAKKNGLINDYTGNNLFRLVLEQ